MPIKPIPPKKPKAGGTLGYYGDSDHDALVQSLDEQIRFLAERDSPLVQRALRHRALYLRASRRFQPRTSLTKGLQPGQDTGRGSGKREGQQYQSTAVVPLAFRTVETKAAAFTDLLFSADPLIEADAVFDKEYGEGSRFITKLCDHAFEGNRLRSALPAVLRDAFADGIKWVRPVWRRMARTVWVNSGEDDVARWNEAISMAVAAMTKEGDMGTPLLPQLPVEQDPESWAQWADIARQAGHKIPEIPITGRQQVVIYEGPWYYRPALGEVLYDPECEYEDQRLLVFSCEVNEDELTSMADIEDDPKNQDPLKPFLMSQVMAAVNKSGSNGHAPDQTRLREAKRSLMEMLGLDDATAQYDKLFGNRHLLEYCYRPYDDLPYAVLLNRCAIVNKDMTQYEYEHGQPPLIPIRHLRLDGNMVGVSAIHQGEPLMKEADRVLAYTLDALLFSVLPVFTRLRNSPLPEGLQRLTAGMLIPVDRHDALAQLTKTVPDMAGAIQMIQFFMSLIDDTESTPPSLRGAPSTVGRVSASEEVGRKTQALSRIKLLAFGVEDDLQPLVSQTIGLYYQFYDEEKLKFVAGEGNPLIDQKAILQASLSAKFRFRGASRAVNRAELLQQLFTWGDKFASVMTPFEVRKYALRVADELGIKRRDDFMLPEQTQVMELQNKVQIEQTKQQALAVLAPAPTPVNEAGGVPLGEAPPPAPPGAEAGAPLAEGAPAGAPSGAPSAPPQAAPQGQPPQQ